MRRSRSERSDIPRGSELQGSITRKINRLESLSGEALRAFWKKRFRSPAAQIQSDEVLRLLIGWKMQVKAFGDLDTSIKDRLREAGRAVTRGRALSAAVGALRPGMVLVRKWRGTEHRVLVLDNGFEHEGRRYRTLSGVARTIQH